MVGVRLTTLLKLPEIKDVEGDDEFQDLAVMESLLTAFQLVMVLPKRNPKGFSLISLIPIIGIGLGITGSLWHVVLNRDKHMPTSMYMENIYGTIPATLIMMVFSVYASKPQLLLDPIKQLGEYHTFGRPPFLAYKDRLINIYIEVTFYLTALTGIVYMLQGILQAPWCERVKQERDLRIVCGFGTYLWIPFSLENFFVKNIVRVAHFWAIWNIFLAGATFCHTTFVFIEHIIIKIDHLKLYLAKAFETPNHEEQEENLMTCIKYHIQIVRLVDVVVQSVKYVLFIHLSISSLVISVCLYNLTLEIKFKPTYFLITYLTSCFLVCHAGQRLLDKSNELSMSIYCMSWYEGTAKLQKDVLFMLMRSQRQLQLKAIITALSYNTFASILSSAYSYWTVMQKH